MQSSPLALPACGIVWQITEIIKSQRWRDGKQSGHLAGMLSISSVLECREHFWPCGMKASLRCEPQPQAIGQHGDGADAAEPKHGKPHQSLGQWPRLLLLRHQ
jgi:hypothetical protein